MSVSYSYISLILLWQLNCVLAPWTIRLTSLGCCCWDGHFRAVNLDTGSALLYWELTQQTRPVSRQDLPPHWEDTPCFYIKMLTLFPADHVCSVYFKARWFTSKFTKPWGLLKGHFCIIFTMSLYIFHFHSLILTCQEMVCNLHRKTSNEINDYDY